MIRVSHVTLPAGLNALARRGPDDELTVYVSDALHSDRQRAAVRIALRASRRAQWRASLPAPSAALLLAFGMTWLRRAFLALRAHSVAWGTASAVFAVASATVYFAAAPHQHGPVGSAPPPAPAASPAPSAIPGQPVAHPRARPSAGASAGASAAAPQGVPKPLATAAVRPTPAPAPAPSGSSSPAPVPTTISPSPVPTVSGRHCITVLGIRTCLRAAL